MQITHQKLQQKKAAAEPSGPRPRGGRGPGGGKFPRKQLATKAARKSAPAGGICAPGVVPAWKRRQEAARRRVPVDERLQQAEADAVAASDMASAMRPFVHTQQQQRRRRRQEEEEQEEQEEEEETVADRMRKRRRFR